MDLIAEHAGLIVFLLFFTMFIGIAVWVCLPGNKSKFQRYAEIPLMENNHGE